MQKLEGVVMLYKSEKEFQENFDLQALREKSSESIFAEERVNFLVSLSKSILRSSAAKEFPDLITFGYYCRKSNLMKLKLKQIAPDSDSFRFGLGTCLHIAPSNIPMNFAFSFLMGFLSGNQNIVRIPTKKFEQLDVFLNLFLEICHTDEFKNIGLANCFVRTERDSNKLIELVANSDALVVWGGDRTVKLFRQLDKKPLCIEVYFPDRVSSVVLDCQHLISLNEVQMESFCRDFYNDTYLVDQNACSSPSIIYWYGNEAKQDQAKQKFVHQMNKYLESSYELATVSKIDKFIDVITFCEKINGSINVEQTSGKLWLLDTDSQEIKPKLGTFISKGITKLDEISTYIRKNEQTLLYFGIDPKELLTMIVEHGKLVDRIVPVGQALSIGMHWDGKNLIDTLSKKIELR